MTGKEHLKGHISFADMVSTHIAAWREALTDTLMLKGDPDDRNFIEHELKALDDIEAALEIELGATAQGVVAETGSDELKVTNKILTEALVPFARYEQARNGMGGNSPKTGALWCCSDRSGDREITVDDMQKALRLVEEHAATAL